MVNVEPKSTKLDEPILKRVEPDLQHSLRDHFYPPRTSLNHVLTSLLSLRMWHLSSIWIMLACFLNLRALKILICLFMSLRRCVHWFTYAGYQAMLWGWNSFLLLPKMMLRGGCMVLKLVQLNLRIFFVDIFLKRYFLTSNNIRIRNEILSFVQLEHEPFWKYMNLSLIHIWRCLRRG